MLLNKTVVGLFKDRSEVDGVMAELQRAGISKDTMRVVDQSELATHENLVGEEVSRREGIPGVLKRLFGSRGYEDFEHSRLHTDWVRNGGLLVAVSTDDAHAGRVAEVMEGSSDVDMSRNMNKTESERALEQKRMTENARSASLSRMEPATPTAGIGRDTTISREPTIGREAAIGREAREEQTIPVIQEELHVGKRKVRRSSVRIIKHVTETPVEETVNLRDERVIVGRHSVERIASDADMRALADSQIEMTETAEEPVVSKEAHVIEEITIGKDIVDHEEKIRDKVRKTDINIEGLGAEKLRELGFKKDFSARFEKLGRNYSEYAPAYEFGSSMAADARYRNRDWPSMESETRRQWEAKGRSWKDFGDAIRHGWESTRRAA